MIIVLMGVSGSGKTTIGKKLAERLGYPFFDADDFHPAANKEKMGKGIALTDEDRLPWLQTLADEMKKWEKGNSSTLLACSALKRKYRDILSGAGSARWIYLKGDRELIRRRLEARKGHFMNHELLESQFAALEEPKDSIVVDIAQDSVRIVEMLIQKLKEA